MMNENTYIIRKASSSDLVRLTEIYNQAIDAGYCTDDTKRLTPEERMLWFEEHQKDCNSIFVYELENEVVGYSCVSAYRKNGEVLSRVGEVSCYVDFYYHGFGFAKQLINHTTHAAKELGYDNLHACTLACNREGIALLKRYNFEKREEQLGAVEFNNKRYSRLHYRLNL